MKIHLYAFTIFLKTLFIPVHIHVCICTNMNQQSSFFPSFISTQEFSV